MDRSLLAKKSINQYLKARMKNQQNLFSHPSYTLEQKLMHCIANGEEEEAFIVLEQINQLERATLAKDPLRSLKNSLICSCTLFTRAAIKGGAVPEDAFNLSDVFIQQIETLNSETELLQLEHEMICAFIDRSRKAKRPAFNHVVNRAIAFIHQEILSDLSLTRIADAVKVNPSYLSKLFKKTVGMSLIDFINRKRIEESKYFLLHSEASVSEIAQIFNFCNQSYYTALFKKYIGLTPKKYRDRYAGKDDGK